MDKFLFDVVLTCHENWMELIIRMILICRKYRK